MERKKYLCLFLNICEANLLLHISVWFQTIVYSLLHYQYFIDFFATDQANQRIKKQIFSKYILYMEFRVTLKTKGLTDLIFPFIVLWAVSFLRQVPAVVSAALPSELQTPVTQFCLEQRSHGGANRHVWAVDFMQLLPVLPGTHTHVAQFSINLGCGSYQPANRCDTFSTWLGSGSVKLM